MNEYHNSMPRQASEVQCAIIYKYHISDGGFIEYIEWLAN